MSKNKKSKKPKKNQAEVLEKAPDVSVVNEKSEKNLDQVTEISIVEEKAGEVSEQSSKAAKIEDKKGKKKDNKKNTKKRKDKISLREKTRGAISEFKKVTWPTFGEVCKKTGVVLVVVLVFAVVVFGIDYCLGLLIGLLR